MELSGYPSLTFQVLELDRMPVNYARAGSGPPVVLLHGWGGEIASFGTIPAILARRFDVVALDLPGFGKTPLPDQPWGTPDYADLVAECLRTLGLGPATLIGHSFGGKTSILVAAQHPEIVQRLVLVDSAGICPTRGPGYYARVYGFKASRALLGLPPLRSVGEPILRRVQAALGSADYQAARSPILRSTLVRVVNDDVRAHLPRIQAPTLLIWGSDDQDTPLADGQLMAKLIPDAGLVVVPGAGHFAYLHDVDHFCRVVTHFVEH
jgi:pimeloyl-ACP methyl ester carboxylesterase